MQLLLLRNNVTQSTFNKCFTLPKMLLIDERLATAEVSIALKIHFKQHTNELKHIKLLAKLISSATMV